MTLFAASLQALAPLFILILLGYGLKRARMLHPAHVPVLNGMVLNVTMPALVLHGLAHATHLQISDSKPIIAMLVTEAVILIIGYALSCLLRFSRPVTGGILMTSAFGNTGFLGYPITLALMAKQFPLAILVDQFSMSVPLYITGAFIGAAFGTNREGGATQRQMIGRFFRSPLFFSVVLGVLVHAVKVPSMVLSEAWVDSLGRIVDRCLELLGQGTIPIVLLAFGVALRAGAARRNALASGIAACLKLLAIPTVLWAVCTLLQVPEDMRRETVLLGAMPTSVMCSVLCGQNDLEGDMAVGIVFITTVFSAATIPLMLELLR